MRKFRNHVGKKNTPRRKPDEMREPPDAQRHGIVVRRIASAERALEMLVDNVGPEKSWGTMLGEQMPGQRDGQKNQNAGENSKLAPANPAAGKQKKCHQNSHREDHAHQAESKNRQ